MASDKQDSRVEKNAKTPESEQAAEAKKNLVHDSLNSTAAGRSDKTLADAAKHDDPKSEQALKLALTPEQKQTIGQKIWQNEASGKVEGLTSWNKGEAFPSLGIGHFIWQPHGSNAPYGDSFRPLLKYMEDNNVKMPKWLHSDMESPWKSKGQFDNDQNSPKMKEMRDFLTRTIPQQTDFIVNRLEQSLPKILETEDPAKQQLIKDRFDRVLKSGPAGTFALVDYVNFKGEGRDPVAQYNNTNWGLKQVLENMKDTEDPVKDFSDSAKQTLQDRVKNAPEAKQAQELKWLYGANPECKDMLKAGHLPNLELECKGGWTNRVDDYKSAWNDKPVDTKTVDSKTVDIKPVAPEQKPFEPHDRSEPAPKPEVASGQFALPQSLVDKAHAKHGEGYYQPLQAFGKELLGRELGNGEIKALVSAARSLRHEHGKNLHSISSGDMLLPQNKKELDTFVKHIQNPRQGADRLSAEQLSKFKSEFSEKYNALASNAPEALPKNVAPVAPQAHPEKVAPKPEAPKPHHDKVAPKPEAPKPHQDKVAPKPEAPKPHHDKVAPKPEAPKPHQDKPVPKPEQEKPKQEKLDKPFVPHHSDAQPVDQDKLQGPVKTDKPAAPGKDSAPAADGDAKPVKIDGQDAREKPPVAPKTDFDDDEEMKVKPGDLGLNVQILNLAGPQDDVRVSNNKNALVRAQVSAPEGLDKSLPVAVVPGMTPGHMGVLSLKDKNGQTHLVPFVAGSMANGHGTKSDVVLNNAAAQELGLRQAKGNEHGGSQGRLDVIELKTNPAALPKDSAELKDLVTEQIKSVVSKSDVLESAERALEGQEIKEKAYVPKPDDSFGYKRSDRSDADLDAIKTKFQAEADKNHQLSDVFKAGGPDADKAAKTVLSDAQHEKARIDAEQTKVQQLFAQLKSGQTADKLPDDLVKNLPADISKELDLAKYNRDAAEKNLQLSNDPLQTLFGLNKDQYVKAMNDALTAAKSQEDSAMRKAAKYAQVDGDKKVLQDRIISDATDPNASQLLQFRFQMKAAAAEVMAANPDMAASKGHAGGLQGARIVINGGHDPFHGTKFTGFPAYEWSKTKDNPQGMSEYDFNKETSALLGAIVEYSGGIPIHVNQDELYKTKPQTQGMSGLAAAMQSHNADIMISNHMDDDKNIDAGTLTLVNSQSHRLGALISEGKGTIGVEPTKAVREQPRGVQHLLRGPAVLNELLTTSPQDRDKLMNPYELAKMQFGVAVGMNRFLHPPSAKQVNTEKALDDKRGSWQDYWSSEDAAAKHEYSSQAFPRKN